MAANNRRLPNSAANVRPEPDRELVAMAEYVKDYAIDSTEAWTTARYSFTDAVGCGLLALGSSDCGKLLGPIVPGTVVPNGVRIPGTRYLMTVAVYSESKINLPVGAPWIK